MARKRKPGEPVNPALPMSRTNPIVDIGKAIELRLKGLTHQEIADYFGVTKQSISERLKGKIPETTNVEVFKRHRADIMAAKQEEILDALTNEDIEKASAYQKVGMYSLLYDKERLERGQSTSNIAYADMTRDLSDMDKEIEALEAELGENEGENG